MHRLASQEPGPGHGGRPQDRAAYAPRNEAGHGAAHPSLQAGDRRDARAGGRGLCGGRGAQGGVRDLPGIRRREQALPSENPRAGLRAPFGPRRDGARPHDCRRSRHHRHAGHRVRRGRPMTLSAASLQKIDKEVAKYPAEQKQSAVMSALIIAQDEKGWLSSETIDQVAQYLEMPPVAVYEVATFYSMYNLK